MRSDANYRLISPDYFRAIGARLLSGRFFNEHDGIDTQPVVIMNAAMVKNVFGDGSALGRKIWFDSFDQEKRYMSVIGVVDNIREQA